MGDPAVHGSSFDLIVRGGTVYDGSGGEPYVADVAVSGDRVAFIGALGEARAATVLEAAGLAVAPGFINMLSHAYTTILHDGRSLSDLMQGVTTEIFGEGWSMGPLGEYERAWLKRSTRGQRYEIAWTTLAGYLDHAEAKGISQNVGSFIGATTLRRYVAQDENRPLADGELATLQGLIREEMAAGALGIGSSLIYAPAYYASTEELIALCAAAAPYGGMYISHMRNESLGLLDGIDELVRIAREAGVAAEIYHLKAAGRESWPLFPRALERIEAARAAGLAITANMYAYAASGTTLSVIVPPGYHEGGAEQLAARLSDPATRAEIRDAIVSGRTHTAHGYHVVHAPETVLFLMSGHPDHRGYLGRTLDDVARERGQEPVDAALDIIAEDRSRVGVAYFLIDEANLRLGLQQPWVSFGSDDASIAAEEPWLGARPHPRAYGNVARLLGRYVRDEGVLTLPEAIRRLTRLPAENLGLEPRGRLEPGYHADLVVFDPATIRDRATFAEPHQYAEGVRDVVVNGRVALRDGAFTGAFAGRAVHGRGKR